MLTASIYNAYVLLSNAMARAKSTEPSKVAAAMEGLSVKGFGKEVEMRKTDHPLQQGLYITRWSKATPELPYSSENTGYSFHPVKYYPLEETSTPTTCEMKRPG